MSGVAARALPHEAAAAGPGPQPWADLDATRYLSAAAHVDPRFARTVVRELLVAEHRLPVPAAGIDLVTVVRHCIAARSRRLYRDAALVVLPLVAAAVSGWATVAWYVWLAGLRLLLRAGGIGTGSDSPAIGGGAGGASGAGTGSAAASAAAASPAIASSAGARAVARFAALLWSFLALVLFTLAATHADPYGLRSAWGISTPSAARVAMWIGVPAAAALCCWLAVFADEVAAFVTVAERLRRDRYTPSRWLSAEPAWAQHALAVLGERLADPRLGHHPLADPANPFVGAGRQVLRRRWLIELGPAASASAPFDNADLLDRICERLADGLGTLDPADALRGRGGVRIDECAISTAPALATRLEQGQVRLIPDARAASHRDAGPRSYRRVRIGGDPSGLTVTAHLGATAGAGLLQVELYGHVLTPIAARYRVADHTPPFGWVAAFRCAVRATARLPHAVFSAPRGVLRTAADPALRRRSRAMLAQAAAAGLTVAAGARFDAREAAAAPAGADRFADEDANLYLSVIERRVREELRPLLPAGSNEF
ncbi:MAG TPA: hypothetical protein VFU73_12980 [Actinocrinis sp.]|nr:hypothetical protein [Actinocrinis sp.]